MLLRDQFENRSGRVIAVFRATLALAFLAALMVEPQGPRLLNPGLLLLGGYFLLSLAQIGLAWRSWWYDHVLTRAALAIDIAVYIAAVFVTEGASEDFTSPFLAIFALTVLSATLRWDWRAAAITGLAVTALFVATGLLVAALDIPLDEHRFWRRVLYMIVLLLVLVWFGVQRRPPRVAPIPALPDAGGMAALAWQAIAFARALTGADRAVLAWNALEEPWTEIFRDLPQGRDCARLGPDALAQWTDERAQTVRLFDAVHGWTLMLGAQDLPRAVRACPPVPFAAEAGVTEGLALPVTGMRGDGLLILGGIPQPGADFLLFGQAIATEIGHALDRHLLAELERETLLTRTRGALARDLHDSVAQSLAGACFRLEALRNTLRRTGADDPARAEQEIVSVRDALRREQAHVRTMIETLRSPAQSLHMRDLATDIALILADAGAQWGVAVAAQGASGVMVPEAMSHEIQQLVREAVANAARHGQARTVDVGLALASGSILIQIQDDGKGFTPDVEVSRPWSISERVGNLAGALSVHSTPGGTRLDIALPAPAGREGL